MAENEPIQLVDGREVTYAQIREAAGEPFTMSMTGEDAKAVEAAVNTHVIDAHLEACFAPARGDSYKWVERKTLSGITHTVALDCRVSVESLPVLVRRLSEMASEAGQFLACAIVDSILPSDD